MLRFVPLTLAACVCAGGQQPAQQPANIVLIYIDNVGWGDLACYGNPVIRTPNIDRLASQGIRLTDFYIPSSSCSPSRGALLTGRYPDRNGLTHQLSTPENWTGIGLPHREKILPEYLREKGYATGAFGKWNIGFAEGSRPTDRGFDEYIGCISGNCDYFTYSYNGRHDLYSGTEPVEMGRLHDRDLRRCRFRLHPQERGSSFLRRSSLSMRRTARIPRTSVLGSRSGGKHQRSSSALTATILIRTSPSTVIER